MWLILVFICLLIAFLFINIRVKKTKAYQSFSRALHVVKDVPREKKDQIAAFGSTFSYYAYDIKAYGGHNFSVEPQSMVYMRKTVEHFLGNIQANGYALISLAGCFFATESVITDEQCPTYYSFLTPGEFEHFSRKSQIKYFLKRYFPAISPNYVKCIVKDEVSKYAIADGISKERGLALAKNRIHGWENVIGQPILGEGQFQVKANLRGVMQRNILRMKEMLSIIRERNIHPVFVILPMSEAFNDLCPKAFYEEILYSCLNSLTDEKVPVLDYLYDKELGKMANYFTADCLNKNGRQLLSQNVANDLNQFGTQK